MLRNPYLLATACLLSMILVSSFNTVSRAHSDDSVAGTTVMENENSENAITMTRPGRSIASEELPVPAVPAGKKPAAHATK